MGLLGAYGLINNQDEMQKAQLLAQAQAQQGLLPAQPAPQGLLGRVTSTPGFWQGLSQAGQGLVQASQGRPGYKPTWAQGISAGLGGFNQGMSDYAAQQLNQRIAQAQIKKAEADAANGPDSGYSKATGVAINPADNTPWYFASNPQGQKVWIAQAPEQYTYVNAGGEIIQGGKFGTRGQSIKTTASPDTVMSNSPDVAGKKAAAVASGTAEGERQQQNLSIAQGANYMGDLLNRIEDVLPKASTSEAGQKIVDIASRFNIATDAAAANKRLDLLATELLSEQAKAKILGSNPTEGERQIYEKLAGQLQTGQALEVRLAALDELRNRLERLKARAGGNLAPTKPQATRKWNPATKRVE